MTIILVQTPWHAMGECINCGTLWVCVCVKFFPLFSAMNLLLLSVAKKYNNFNTFLHHCSCY